MKNLINILLLCSTTINMVAAQKLIQAMRTQDNIKIDGHFDEEVWQNDLDVATDFTSLVPIPNQRPRVPTEVRVLYDDEAIYISAFMTEYSDSLRRELSIRDDAGNNADFFGVIIDAYGNGTNALEFIVTSSNVQLDTKIGINFGDGSWDAVWESAVNIHEKGWNVEIKLPFAALRFPKKAIQSWNINFSRYRVVDGSFQAWNNVDFEQNNAWLTMMGKLEGCLLYTSPSPRDS